METKQATGAIPAYPGKALRKGSASTDVSLMQTYLNALQAQMPSLSKLTVDGKYGSGTEKTVRQYQVLNNLSADGVIGKESWDHIVTTYNANYPIGPNTYPGTAMRNGSRGVSVETMQQALNDLSVLYTAIPKVQADGKYGAKTTQATELFQMQFWMADDGVIGKKTWDAVLCIRNHMQKGCPEPVTPTYRGSMRKGDSGNCVRLLQSYLNWVSKASGDLSAPITVDGNFGTKTHNAVLAFQARFGLSMDGIAGRKTWERLVLEANAALAE